MSRQNIPVLTAGLALIFAAGAPAANDLAVNPDAAIDGVYGLEVLVDGSANQAFVADTHPSQEIAYRASFRIGHNNLSMAEGTGHAVFMGRMAGGVGNVLRLFMVRQGGTYKLRCRWKKDIDGTGFCGQLTFAPVNTRVTVEWAAATSPGADDGFIRLFKGDVLQAERTGLDNDTYVIDTARLGLPQGASPTTSGSFYLDDFTSFRTLSP